MQHGFAIRSIVGVAVAASIASLALASGGIRRLKLDEAVRSAPFVLLVEKAEPFEETVTYQRSYQAEDGGSKVAKLETRVMRFKVIRKLGGSALSFSSTAADSYLHPGTRHEADMQKLGETGQLIGVISRGTVINHGVKLRQMADGTRKIPIYPRLADAASYDQIEKGKRFVLLASYSASYHVFVGRGGHGLVPAGKLKQVKRLLRRR